VRQAGRSRVRFPIRSTDFSIDLILPGALRPWGGLKPVTTMSITNPPGGKVRPARRADNLTAICEPPVHKMWVPRSLTNLWASTACYSFIFLVQRVNQLEAFLRHLCQVGLDSFHPTYLHFSYVQIFPAASGPDGQSSAVFARDSSSNSKYRLLHKQLSVATQTRSQTEEWPAPQLRAKRQRMKFQQQMLNSYYLRSTEN
jgi:hypothetical protein